MSERFAEVALNAAQPNEDVGPRLERLRRLERVLVGECFSGGTSGKKVWTKPS